MAQACGQRDDRLLCVGELRLRVKPSFVENVFRIVDCLEQKRLIDNLAGDNGVGYGKEDYRIMEEGHSYICRFKWLKKEMLAEDKIYQIVFQERANILLGREIVFFQCL